MGIYDKKISSVAAKIKAKGQAVTWQKTVAGAAVDADKPWLGSEPVPLNFPAHVLFLPYSKDAPNETKSLLSMAGTNLIEGRLYGLMGSTGFVPSPADTVLRDGATVNVETVDTLAPDGKAILYIVGFTQ